ncbi:MAG: hypothetical protein QGG48_05805 [Desulfatiglandales bacterium]|jgi:hypothetical protein|nr:hypothetical protein [Desulfatiglandales bacterium]
MGFLAYNLLHLIRQFYLLDEDTLRSIEWVIMGLVKAGARIVYQPGIVVHTCCVGFSVEAPLPGRAWFAALRGMP